VNTATPGEALSVNGNINASGTINSLAGIDLAESFNQLEPLHAGEIVAIPANNPLGDDIIKATKANAQFVIGVVSTQPGMTLNKQGLANPTHIAIAGRVPVQVSGTVEPGDFITVSDTPGIGERATQAGFVLGRALTASQDGMVVMMIQPYYFNPAVAADGTIVGGDNKKAFFEDKSAAGQAAISGFATSNAPGIGKKVGQDIAVQLGGSEDVVVTLG
jgi:hypothetical protein